VGTIDNIAILAMGPTWYKCPREVPPNSEIWGINTMYRNHPNIDRIFMMHDLRTEIVLQDKNFVKSVNDYGAPVYTNKEYNKFTNNVVYPIPEMIKEFNIGFFLNCICYMLAYAISLKPKTIVLYGVDMRPDSGQEWHQMERGCVEFWCGMAMGRGIDVSLPAEANVLKRHMVGNWYGFYEREEEDGLYRIVPLGDRNQYDSYILIPFDDDGNLVPSDSQRMDLKDVESLPEYIAGGSYDRAKTEITEQNITQRA